jgi:multisubunit Na+/H+ antiporter MnhB subunit
MNLTIIAIFLVFYILPLFWVIGFAKREKKDWRIALAAGLAFSWLVALVIVLIVPQLSDENHRKINMGGEHGGSNQNDLFVPLIWSVGGLSVLLVLFIIALLYL